MRTANHISYKKERTILFRVALHHKILFRGLRARMENLHKVFSEAALYVQERLCKLYINSLNSYILRLLVCKAQILFLENISDHFFAWSTRSLMNLSRLGWRDSGWWGWVLSAYSMRSRGCRISRLFSQTSKWNNIWTRMRHRNVKWAFKIFFALTSGLP